MSAYLGQEGFPTKHKLSAKPSKTLYSNAPGLRVKEWLNRVEAQSILFKETAVEFLTLHCQTLNRRRNHAALRLCGCRQCLRDNRLNCADESVSRAEHLETHLLYFIQEGY